MKRVLSRLWPAVGGTFVIAMMLLPLSAAAQTLSNRWSFYGAQAPSGNTTVTDSVNAVVATLNGDASLDGNEVNFDGTAGTFVELGTNLISTLPSFSIEVWGEAQEAGNSAHFWEFSDGGGSGGAYARYEVIEGVSPTWENQFEIADGPQPNQELTDPLGLPGIPLQVVCVFDPANGVQAIYTNGVLEALRTFAPNSTTPSDISPNEASLGRSPWFNFSASDPTMTGTIQEFRIWSGVLSPLEIGALYTAGPTTVNTNVGTVTSIQVHAPLQLTQFGTEQAAVDAVVSGWTVQPDVTASCTFSSGNSGILTVSASGLITGVAPGATTVSAVFNPGSGALTNSILITVVPPQAALSNRWSFYAPSASAGGTSVTDSVHGVIATLNGGAALDGQNVNLDGASGYVLLPQGVLSNQTSVTIEAWISTNSASPDNVALFAFDPQDGAGDDYFRYVLHEPFNGNANGANFLQLGGFPQSAHETGRTLTGQPGLGNSGPLHVVCIFDPVLGVQGIYTNGMLEANGTFNGANTPLVALWPLFGALGQSPFGGDPYLQGSITEFRIYGGELSPQKVALDYLAGPTQVNTNGPGAIQSVSLSLPPTLEVGLSQIPGLIVNYANLTNFNLTANSVLPVSGLTVSSSASNVVNVVNNVLVGVSNGVATITVSYQGFTNQATITTWSPPAIRWQAPVSFNGLGDAIFTSVPGLLVGAEVFAGGEQTVTLSDGTNINFVSDGSVATTTGNGTFAGAYPAGVTDTNGNLLTTGNASFDSVLNEANYDGGPKTINLVNLTPGLTYAVQLFGVDDRVPENARLAYYSDPNQAVPDVSQTFTMGGNDYVIGVFQATSTTRSILMNLPTGNSGNMNALVVYVLPGVSIQQVGTSVQLKWPTNMLLLQAPSLKGPWTTNPATPPYLVTPTGGQMFYRALLP